LEGTVPFPGGRALIYSITAADVTELSATLDAALNGGRVAVLVPKSMARAWLSPDQTGMENLTSTPRILIEKDFQCLHRSMEEDADGFPNPLLAEPRPPGSGIR
jgi:mRNA degradation ribonuclease J1/J2